MLLGYLGRISKHFATEIRKDRRTYTNEDGTQSGIRAVKTWEEAHALAVDMDNDVSATRAITQPVMFNQNPWREDYPGAYAATWESRKEKPQEKLAARETGQKEFALID